MKREQVKNSIRTIPDFPRKGIQFKDLTTVFIDPDCMDWFKQELVNFYKDKGITKIVGLESRGFILAPVLASELHAGFVPIRKKGKLPAEVISQSYEKEYGVDTIEIHKDALSEDDVVLIHDDLLATGGSMEAALKLVKRMGVKRIFINFLVELDDLNGRKVFGSDIPVYSLIHY